MRVPAAADQWLEPDRSPIHEALNVAWARECDVKQPCMPSFFLSSMLKAHFNVSYTLSQPTMLPVPLIEHEAMGDYMDKTFTFWSQSQGVQQQT